MQGIQISIEDKSHALERLANQLSDRNMDKAKVRGINRALQKSNTQYRREIVKNYNLKYADTKEMAVPRRASYTKPEGTISGRVKPLSLSRFNPTFVKDGSVFSIKSKKNKETGKRGLQQMSKKATKRNSFEGGGVQFEIKKGNKERLPFAFFLKSNKPGVYQQVFARGKYQGNKFKIGKKRYPITTLKTAAPFGMMTEEETQKRIKETASDSMQKEFNRQIQRMLEKAGAR